MVAINTAALSDLGRKFVKVAVGLNSFFVLILLPCLVTNVIFVFMLVFILIHLPIVLRNEDYQCRSYRY